MATMVMNQLINNGDGLFMDRGNKGPVNILPPNVKPKTHIKKVDHYHSQYGQTETIRIVFTNGHIAELKFGHVEYIDEEDLKVFQATCIMVHDI